MVRQDQRPLPGISEQARENRAYVRHLLRKKQPEFAAMLERAVRELLAREPAISDIGSAGVTCRCR